VGLNRMMCVLFFIILWGIPAWASSTVEYTYYDSFPVFINAPADIAYDPVRKTLYVAERGTRCIFEIGKTGLPLGTIFADAPKILDFAFNPQDEGGFFITQGEKGDLLETDRHGCLRKSFRLPEVLQKEKVQAITISPENGKVFIVTAGEQDKVFVVTTGGSCEGHLSFKDIENIDAIHYDPISQHLLLLCSGKKQLYEATPAGEVVGHFPIEVAQAKGVARDEAGLLYVICEKSKRVYVYLPKKRLEGD
jgi:uncharacterized protein YjiK